MATTTARSEAALIASMGMGNTGAVGDAADQMPWEENLNQILICPDCRENPPNLVEEFSNGDVVCGSCGIVLGDRIIDTRSEWRTFANDDQNNDDPSRVGEAANPLLHGSQLETTIAFGEGGRARELSRAQARTQKGDKSQKGLNEAYRIIGHYCDAISIPKTAQDSAKHIFKMADDEKIFKGKPVESVIAGCIFIACRQSKVPRTFREIYALTKVSKKEIGKTFKMLEKFLQDQAKNPKNTNKQLASLTEDQPKTSTTNATELCERYCNGLRFDNTHLMARIASELCDKSSSVKDLAGRSPLSVAAACIYMVSYLMGESRTSKQIAAVAGVSDGTIKTAYRFLYQAREQLVDQTWLDKGGRLDRLPVN
ncbi:Uu.00g007340.m01.CDS01 [Anthostomella pinea]|uniref:Transcription initiation factor IIB n=1 Tax=Anthostomella pinea TaxID=933095 RepID=A0AAI8VXW3_9PEZI|nr:Uu.00g007340.m01.CDS01 [Anthostomella pinea]